MKDAVRDAAIDVAVVFSRCLAEQQLEQHRRLREQQVHTQDALDSLAAFSGRIGARLQGSSIADPRAPLRLVIERIAVHDDHLEVQHVIPLRDPTTWTMRASADQAAIAFGWCASSSLPRSTALLRPGAPARNGMERCRRLADMSTGIQGWLIRSMWQFQVCRGT